MQMRDRTRPMWKTQIDLSIETRLDPSRTAQDRSKRVIGSRDTENSIFSSQRLTSVAQMARLSLGRKESVLSSDEMGSSSRFAVGFNSSQR